jgi:hypothetical protein
MESKEACIETKARAFICSFGFCVVLKSIIDYLCQLRLILVVATTCLALTTLVFPSTEAHPVASDDSVLLSGDFKELSLLMRGRQRQHQQLQQDDGNNNQQEQRLLQGRHVVKPGFSYGFAHTAPLNGGAVGVFGPPEAFAAAAAEKQRGVANGAEGDDGVGQGGGQQQQEEVAGYLATQYHTQSHEGDAAFGYAHPGQAHTSIRDANGGVTG